MNEKLLNIYLALLEFPNCPDRQPINFNCGVLFFMSSCYANAYSFFLKSGNNPYEIANLISITLAHLDEFNAALMYAKYSIDSEPDNVIYQCNFMILKWICGI